MKKSVSKGKVVKIISNLYTVLVDNTLVEARLRGIFRKNGLSLLVGDEVLIDVEKKWITDILPRKNYLLRPKVSNIDLMIITTSLKEPNLSLLLLDKQISFLEYHKIPSIIIFTKYDLLTKKEQEEVDKIKNYYNKIGISTLINTEIIEIKKLLKNKAVALLGNSGVGKSTLINTLGNLNIETNKISYALGRGIHTTRHVEIYPVNDFYLIDTPGFSSLLLDVPKESLSKTFIEFNNYTCKFNNCSHNKEIGCRVRDSVGKEILPSRYENYLKLRSEVK